MTTMSLRQKILTTLDKNFGKRFSIAAMAQAVGANHMATAAALSRLHKSGIIDRPEKGLYSAKKGRPSPATPRPETTRPAETVPTLFVISIDLLVQMEQGKTDTDGLLRRILEHNAVLDAKVRGIAEADRTRLKIRFSLSDEQ